MDHGTGLRDHLHDHVALNEIELYAEVLIAVADTDQRLSTSEIDRALGLSPSAEEGGTGTHRPSNDHRTASRVDAPTPAPTDTARPSRHAPAAAPLPAPRTEEAPDRPGPSSLPAPGDHRSSPSPWVLPRPAGGVRTLHTPHDPSSYRFVPWYV